MNHSNKYQHCLVMAGGGSHLVTSRPLCCFVAVKQPDILLTANVRVWAWIEIKYSAKLRWTLLLLRKGYPQ